MLTPQTREYRSFDFTMQDNEMRVTGTPVVFNSPTVMYEYDGAKYYEQISSKAFDGVDLSDVVLNVNHQGTPAARTKNHTMTLEVRSDVLFMDSDLSKSSIGPALRSDIANGVYDKMSFAFTVAQESYDVKTRTRTIEKIDQLFDVSVVTFPAYKQTTVSARSFFEAEAEKERVAEAIRCERKRKRIQIIAQAAAEAAFFVRKKEEQK